MEDVKLLIGDRDVAAKSAATFNRFNPLSGEVATKAAAAQVEDAIAAAEAAATIGAGNKKKNPVNNPVTATTNDSEAGRGSNRSAGASKYITLTIRI